MLGQISQLVFLCSEAGLRPFKQNVGDGRSVIRKVTLKRSVRELRILNRHHEPLCFLGTGCGDGKRPCVPWKRMEPKHCPRDDVESAMSSSKQLWVVITKVFPLH